MNQCPTCGLQRGLSHSILPGCMCAFAAPSTPLTPPQRPWVGLTDEEIDLIYMGAGKNDLRRARAIEAKLKEKNT